MLFRRPTPNDEYENFVTTCIETETDCLLNQLLNAEFYGSQQ